MFFHNMHIQLFNELMIKSHLRTHMKTYHVFNIYNVHNLNHLNDSFQYACLKVYDEKKHFKSTYC